MEKEINFQFEESLERDFVSSLDAELLVCGYAEEKTGLDSFHPFRSDPFFRMYYPIEGMIQVSGCEGSTVIEPGRSYLFPADVPFRFISMGGFTHKWVHFCSKSLSKMQKFRKILSVESKPEDSGLWTGFLEAAQKPASLEQQMESNLFLRRLLLPFLKEFGIQDYLHSRDQERFQPVLDYFEEHFQEPVSILPLAKRYGMPRAVFSHDFREAFGVPPKQYLTRVRINNAKKLLLTTKCSIKEVAQLCGYENEYFFYRVFHQTTGETPTNFRKKMRFGY